MHVLHPLYIRVDWASCGTGIGGYPSAWCVAATKTEGRKEKAHCDVVEQAAYL